MGAVPVQVRCRYKRVADVPITFRNRQAGESKLTMQQNVLYVKQLLRLYLFAYGPLAIALPLLLIGAALALLAALLGLANA